MKRLPRSLDEIRGLRVARWIRESTAGQYDRHGPASQREQQDRFIERHGLVAPAWCSRWPRAAPPSGPAELLDADGADRIALEQRGRVVDRRRVDRQGVRRPTTGSLLESWRRWVHRTGRLASTGRGSNARCATWPWTTSRNGSTTRPTSNVSGSSAWTVRRWM